VPAAPRIAVIVPSHRAADTVGACLDGLAAQTLSKDEFEVHVVDTGEDATGRVVARRAGSWDGRLHFHRATVRGPAVQRNLGAERTAAEFLAFTDADCVPEPGWLEAGLERLTQGASIVQGPTSTPDGGPAPPFSHAIVTDGPTPLYESCNVMYDARAFRAAGGFPTDYFDLVRTPFGEDAALAWAVRRTGGTAVFEPRARVRHAVFEPDFSRHLGYQWQIRFFPELVRRVPELRRELLTARLFLGRRSLRACAALAAAMLASRYRIAWLLALPMAVYLAGIALRARDARAAAVGVGKHAASDAVRQAALVWGSVRFRSPVL
jgi:glycosyltransferase involved in cell wall biosynthesis